MSLIILKRLQGKCSHYYVKQWIWGPDRILNRNYATRRKSCSDQVRALNEKFTKPASHVIMNLDGVVLDTLRAIQESHDKYLTKWKKSLNKELRLDVTGRRSADAGEIVTKALELPFDCEVYAHGIWQHQRQHFRAHKLKLIKGADELICYFKENRIPIALVSSCDTKSFLVKTRNHENLIDKFCHVVLGDDKELKRGKPHPDIYLLTASRFRSAPKEMHKYVVIESSIHGIRGAKAAGMQTVFLPDRIIPQSLHNEADVTLQLLDKFDPHDFKFPPK